MQHWSTLHQEKQYETPEVIEIPLTGTQEFCSISDSVLSASELSFLGVKIRTESCFQLILYSCS